MSPFWLVHALVDYIAIHKNVSFYRVLPGGLRAAELDARRPPYN